MKAFALLASGLSRGHASSAHAANAPDPRRFAVQYLHPRASGIFHWPWPELDTPRLGVLAPHLGAEFGSPTGLPFFSGLPQSDATRSHGFLFIVFRLTQEPDDLFGSLCGR